MWQKHYLFRITPNDPLRTFPDQHKMELTSILADAFTVITSQPWLDSGHTPLNHTSSWSLIGRVVSAHSHTNWSSHYNDVIMGAMASQITNLAIVYSIVYSGADQRIHQSSASLAFVWGIHRGPVNSPHKWPVTRKMLPLDDVSWNWLRNCNHHRPNTQ